MMELTLDLRQVATSVVEADVWLHNVELNQRQDLVMNELITSLTGYMLTRQEVESEDAG